MVAVYNSEGAFPSNAYEAYADSPFRTIKHSTYFQVYDYLFNVYRGKPVTFLEIGVLGGGSLMMWRKFLGPKARIIGIDRNPHALKLKEFGFEIFIGDQGNPKFWSEVIPSLGAVDVVLDDGGHTYSQQVETVHALLPTITNGGLMVVEDTHTSYQKGFGPKQHSFVRFAQKYGDGINKRFSGFDAGNSSAAAGPVWSVQFFESIVCFHVDRERAHLLSRPTENMSREDLVVDFRYGAPGETNFFSVWLDRFMGGRPNPVAKFLLTLASMCVGIFRRLRTRLDHRYVRIEQGL